jgi:hypothetical protein
LHVEKDFATYWGGNLHILEIKPMTQCVQDKCFHIGCEYGKIMIDTSKTLF